MAKKKNEVVPMPEPPEMVLEKASTAELRAELARGLSLTADVLTRLGLVWAELERRGEDLSDLRHGLARALPLIASGRLAAEAVVAFAGKPALLRALDGVPLERQRAMSAGTELVDVIDPASPDKAQSMLLASLPAAAYRLVFADGEVRSPEAQRLALRPRRHRAESEKGYRYRPRFDAQAGTIKVGRMTIRLADLLAELVASASPDRPAVIDAGDDPASYDVVRVRLTHTEAEKFRALCARAELPDWEMCRKALRAFGLI